ncbi:MAG: hypothetical protein B0A82_01410 [Alkalinema sp. CACIAM 70d]|nr:MAG: hypothetical protein B0A82_01410 [Alkalinema sp. CACIAM 70d]
MGCNLKLRVWCKSDQLPGQRLLDLVNHLGKSSLFGRIFRVGVKKSPHYFKGDYITFEQLGEKGLPRNEITRIVEQYINQPVTFEAWWKTHSYHEYLEENIYGRRVRKIVEKPWRIALPPLLKLEVENWIIFIAFFVGSAGIFCLPYTMTKRLSIYLLYLLLQAYFLFGILLFSLCAVANKCL